MPRYRITIEYDGRPFAGWQRQDNAPSVQESLECAAEKLDGAPVLVYGAGRTDSGVHALGQVAHLDLTKDLSTDKVRDAINYHLKPHPVAVIEAERVSEEFHAGALLTVEYTNAPVCGKFVGEIPAEMTTVGAAEHARLTATCFCRRSHLDSETRWKMYLPYAKREHTTMR